MVTDAWLRLIQATGPASRGWTRAIRQGCSIEELLQASPDRLAQLGLEAEAIERLHEPDAALLERWREWLEQAGHRLVVIGSEAYPANLAEIPDAPPVLWAAGARPELLHGLKLAIVGSRNPTQSGRRLAEAFARDLSARGLTIVSGLAVGIDAASHEGGLQGPGGSIAVLGCGIDQIYPRVNAALGARLLDEGLIVSEYPPGIGVRRHQFPQRNRIIAGLSAGTLVVEATTRSGSLITARLAADYAREVFAIPGSIHSPLSRGCHRLLRSGATLVEQIDDILGEIAPQFEPSQIAAAAAPEAADVAVFDDPSYARLLQALDFEPATIAELMDRSGLTAAELSSMLLLLEMSGAVEALPGARYCRLVKRLR